MTTRKLSLAALLALGLLLAAPALAISLPGFPDPVLPFTYAIEVSPAPAKLKQTATATLYQQLNVVNSPKIICEGAYTFEWYCKDISTHEYQRFAVEDTAGQAISAQKLPVRLSSRDGRVDVYDTAGGQRKLVASQAFEVDIIRAKYEKLTDPVACGTNARIRVEPGGGVPPYHVYWIIDVVDGGAKYRFSVSKLDFTGPVELSFPVTFGQRLDYLVDVSDSEGGLNYKFLDQSMAINGSPPAAPEFTLLSAQMDPDFIPDGGNVNLLVKVAGGVPPYTLSLYKHAVTETNQKSLLYAGDIGLSGPEEAVPIFVPADLLTSHPDAVWLQVSGSVRDAQGRTRDLPGGLQAAIHYPLGAELKLDKQRLTPGGQITAAVTLSQGTPPYHCVFTWYVSDNKGPSKVRTQTLSAQGPGVSDTMTGDYTGLEPPISSDAWVDVEIRDSGWGRYHSGWKPFLFGRVGDANGDTAVNLADLTHLTDRVLSPAPETVGYGEANADINGDNKINLEDARLLINMLVN